MLWQVRVSLADRPGAMAKLAAVCGDHDVNILALDVLPALNGRVIDELVLHAPDGWTAADVARLCRGAGAGGAQVTECSAHALEDQPVRYLRAVTELVDRPDRLEELLCRLLDAAPAAHSDRREQLVLDDGSGPTVALARQQPFSDTERARAAELRTVVARIAGAAAPWTADGSWDDTRPDVGSVVLREGSLTDLAAVRELHSRCSAETLRRRYHFPFGFLTPRLARELLEPEEGFSLLMTVPDGGRERVVAMGLVVVQQGVAEAALMVEDSWQRRGLGSSLLHALAVGAAGSGVSEMVLSGQPDHTAVLATLNRASLAARVDLVDGMCRYRVSVRRLRHRERKAGHPSMGTITTPLVALLHQRGELREVLPAADLIDSAIRDGA